MLLALQLNNLLETPAAIAPVFSGPIPDISRTLDTGTYQYDLGAYFTGADSYAIAPSVETGWSFDTGAGLLEIDTDALGAFGPFTVTATNVNGDTPSNAFSVAVVAAQIESEVTGGGWLFLNQYELEKQRRRARDRRRKQLEEESERIEDATDRQIAQLLRVQEAKDDKREDYERLATLARANADLDAARRYSERVATAYARVLAQGNYSAIEALDREMKRAAEEEEFLLLSILMLD